MSREARTCKDGFQSQSDDAVMSDSSHHELDDEPPLLSAGGGNEMVHPFISRGSRQTCLREYTHTAQSHVHSGD